MVEDFRLALFVDDYHIFDSDTYVVFDVDTRLAGESHTRLKMHFVIASDVRRLVFVIAYAVAETVVEVYAVAGVLYNPPVRPHPGSMRRF